MFTASDTKLTDLDFELRDDRKRNQTIFVDETTMKDFMSSSSPSTTNYRIGKPM